MGNKPALYARRQQGPREIRAMIRGATRTTVGTGLRSKLGRPVRGIGLRPERQTKSISRGSD